MILSMIKEVKSVGFVCMANYCRSPVAMMLSRNKYRDSVKIDSAGLNPMVSAGMDSRSLDYLKKKNISCKIHNPKKLDKDFLSSSDIVFAMDPFILMNLNKSFKFFRTKFKLFSFQHRSLNIKDPYRLTEEEYINVMDDINFVVENLDLEELY